MRNAAITIPAMSTSGQTNTGLLPGRIRIAQGASYWVDTVSGILRSRKASSCLIEPEASDLVLIYADDRGDAYVLAVLERDSAAGTSLLFEKGLHIKVQNGDLEMTAQRIKISGEELAMSSAELQVDSLKGKVRIMDLSFIGRVLDSQIQRIKWAAQSCNSAVGHLCERVKRSYRFIDEFEQTRAGRIVCLVRDTLFMKGKQSILMAEKRIKMDAEKIHLG